MLKFLNRRVLCSGMLLSLVSMSQTNSALAANLTTAQLNSLLKDPSVKVSATSNIVMGAGPIVTVLTEEDSKTADQDLKIDALFLSKVLMEAAPGQIEKVKILFSQSGRDGRFIIIDNKEIQDFGHGKISPEKMLASMRFSDVEPERAPDVMPGTQFERRLLVWNRIKRLRQQGTGVSPFENIFRDIESAVKAGDANKVSEKVAYLESKLSDQEEQVKQAKKSAQGRGVPAIASHSSVGATGGATAQSSGGGNRGAGYVPPDAERIKRIFVQDSENWVRTVESKNSSQGAELRKMKKSADEKFAAKQDAAAFEEIGNMITILRKDLGYDPFRPDQGQGGGGTGPNGTGPNGGGRNGSGPMGGGPNGGGGPMGGGPNGGGPMGGGPMGGGPMGGGPGGGGGPGPNF